MHQSVWRYSSLLLGEKVDFSQYMDSNVVTGVLKLFLRELPVPVVSHDAYGEIMKATGEMLSIPIYIWGSCDGMLCM